jgi:hypothetical protein
MKNLIISTIFSLFSLACFSQETNAYMFFVNVVNDDFKYPLFGLVNVAKGNHKGLQLGFANWNARNFSGLQMGFVNTIGENLNGAQVAYINTAIQQVEGMQFGFINTARQDVRGGQIGYVNFAVQGIYGTQFGFINSAFREISGSQTGFINLATKLSQGIQFGFVNLAVKDSRGAQFGFVNTALKESPDVQVGFVNIAGRKKSGVQLGFVNFADSIGKAVPVGFMSFIRRGGYMAVEVGFSEFFPMTVGFKTGIEKFYTTLYLGYKPSGESAQNTFATGFGIGSIIPFKKSFFFNPEIHSMNTIGRAKSIRHSDNHTMELNNNRQLTSFVPFFGYNLNDRVSITAGPSVVWSASYGGDILLKPVFHLANFEINDKHSIFIGARGSIRYRF